MGVGHDPSDFNTYGWQIDFNRTTAVPSNGPFGQLRYIGVPLAERLRVIAGNVGTGSGLLTLVGALLIALDGITSGERRPLTQTSKLTVIAAGLLGVIIALVGLGRAIDILTGGRQVAAGAAWRYRVTGLTSGLATGLSGAVTAMLAWVTVDDHWRLEATASPDAPGCCEPVAASIARAHRSSQR